MNSGTSRQIVQPKITAIHTLATNSFSIEIDLPGANKETVELEVGTYGLSVKAEGDTVQYYGTWPLDSNITPEQTTAKYDNGALYISAPIKEKTLKGNKIDIMMT